MTFNGVSMTQGNYNVNSNSSAGLLIQFHPIYSCCCLACDKQGCTLKKQENFKLLVS